MVGCGQTSVTWLRSTMELPPSTHPSELRERRSSALIRKRHPPIEFCNSTNPSPKGITMTNADIKCILSRRATKYYDPAATLSDDEMREQFGILVEAAGLVVLVIGPSGDQIVEALEPDET